MMQPGRALLRRAIDKAAGAYGQSIQADLDKAISRLRERPGRLDACRQALRMGTVPAAVLWARIRRLQGWAG